MPLNINDHVERESFGHTCSLVLQDGLLFECYSLWEDYVNVCLSLIKYLTRMEAQQSVIIINNDLRLSFIIITYISDHIHDSRSKQ